MADLTARPMTRREARIERMRTQYMGHAQRSTYRTSGTPHMAQPGLSRPDADLFTNIERNMHDEALAYFRERTAG